MSIRNIIFMGGSLKNIGKFPVRHREYFYYQLESLAMGENPIDWKPMPSIGIGVKEIRSLKGGTICRVIYVINKNVVYVLHAFMKKTRKTKQADIDLAKLAFKAMKRLTGNAKK